MKRRLSSLQCLRNRDSLLLHCPNQCLSYARRQLHYLLYRVCLNQKAGEGWASSQINAFLQMLNLNRKNISCHAGNIVARITEQFNMNMTITYAEMPLGFVPVDPGREAHLKSWLRCNEVHIRSRCPRSTGDKANLEERRNKV